MTQDPTPLITIVGDDDTEMCGPDGCALPAGHPALNHPNTPKDQKDDPQQ